MTSPSAGAVVHQLVVKPVFDGLEKRDKLYAHYMARAAWHGTRVILRQVSPESPDIFDFIMEVYHACDGKWDSLAEKCNITPQELNSFLEYCATFLCNLGNFYGEGDQKFIPDLSIQSLRKIADSSNTTGRLDKVIHFLFTIPPHSLGYPNDSNTAQSGYYPSAEPISEEEIAMVSRVLEKHSIGPENTRVGKVIREGQPIYQVLQASVNTTEAADIQETLIEDGIFLIKGDHSEEMYNISANLTRALEYTSNNTQTSFLKHYIESFRTGSLEAFQESQKAWVTDTSARVEHLIDFTEPCRDPAGIRAEWEAVIGIADPEEVARLKLLVDSSTKIIRGLPWASKDVNDGKGAFEKSLFEAPDLTSIHALAVCGSVVFEAANLPNYEYIRETCGFKNIVLANRLSANNNPALLCPWVDGREVQSFQNCAHIIRYITTAIHEGAFNYDHQNPPINPISGKVIASHYLPGQTWSSVFGKLAGTVEECRAILMSKYLMDNKDILQIFGYNDKSKINAEELIYASYLSTGVEGLQALEHYNADNQAWGQVHHQAHFSILKYLLQEGGGVIRILYDPTTPNLIVRVDRNRILSHGKPALGRYLCRLHIWRCTADYSSCKEFYEPLCAVDGEYEQWRQIVSSKPRPRWKFVQPNTFVTGETVEMKVYEASNRGIIQSWAERAV